MKFDTAIANVGGDYGPTPGMLANIILRTIVNLTAALACWVPFKLFHDNGELAGMVMVVAIGILNLYYALNAVIWHDDDIASWPKGYGWCDIQLATFLPLETLNAAAICAVMQNISNQVSLMRASELTRREKRRKNIMQALIIIPVPALQAVLYYFNTAKRYSISGIAGCQAVFTSTWVFLTLFILPIPVFAVAAAYFAGLTWWRYKKIDVIARRALFKSGDFGSRAKSNRTKRKLYFMALTIIAPYCPMQLVFSFNNIKLGMPWSKPYDFAQLHAPGWDQIDYMPSTTASFVTMYINYIAALEVIVFFIYFGRTEEAYEMYRKYLRAAGPGKIFARLNERWPPSPLSSMSVRRLWPRSSSAASSGISKHSRSSSIQDARSHTSLWPLSDHDDTLALSIHVDSLNLEAARSIRNAADSDGSQPQRPYRNPWIFRTTLEPRFDFLQLPNTPVTPAIDLRSTSQVRPTAVCHRGNATGDKERVWPCEHVGEPTMPPRVWAASDGSTSLPGSLSNLRRLDYERGLVSVKKDFSSSTPG